MAHKNENDLRVLKTKQNIRRTFINMLCEMDFEKITVKELAERAMINRKTFYSHYDSLDILLQKLQNEMAQEFIKRTKNMKRPKDLDKVTREFFIYSEELGKFGEKLNCSDSHVSKQVTDFLMQQTWNLPKEYSSPYVQNIIKSFVSQATLIIYRQWLKDEKKLSLDEIIKLASKLICNGVNNLEK